MSWTLCDLYGVLGVGQEASGEEIKVAYRRAALQHHPDKGGSVETFKLVAHAFETLFCPNSRARYDRRRASFRGTAGGRHAAGGAPCDGKATTVGAGLFGKSRTAAAAAAAAAAGAFTAAAGGGLGRRSAVPREERRAESGARRLLCAMRRLCALLRAVSKEDRRAALDSASGPLRQRLLAFMEAQKSEGACQPAAAAGGRGCLAGGPGREGPGKSQPRYASEDLSEEESLLALEAPPVVVGTVGAVPAPHGAAAEDLPRARRGRGPALQGAEDFTESGSQRKNVRFPGIYMRTGWRQDFYVAAAGLENFTIFSRNVRSLEEAVNYHIALLQVKCALEANSQASAAGRPFRERLAAALREAPPLDGLQPSFYTVLTCARSFGAKKIRSPATVDLQEALDHHQRLTEARRLGHVALRAAWAEVLQVERTRKAGARGNAIKRPRTREEAEEFVAGAERAAKAWHDARAAARREAQVQAASIGATCPGFMRPLSSLSMRAARRLGRLRRLLALAERMVARERRRELGAHAKQKAAAKRAALRERARHRLAKRLAAKRLREELLERERRWRTRRAWLRSGRARTFAEEQRGPPGTA